MANEIAFTSSFRLINGDFKATFSPGSLNADQSTKLGGGPGAVTVGTSHENIVSLDVVTQGFMTVVNLDSTNFIEIGVEVTATFYPLVRVNAGEGFVMRLSPSVSVYAKADTADCNCEFRIYST